MTKPTRLMKELAVPAVVAAANGALAGITGMWIFALAAVAIAVLVALKARHLLRQDKEENSR